MGGYGSGRPGYKRKAEDCRSLDIYKMKRLGCFVDGMRGDWVWSRDGERVASISYHCTGFDLVLNFRHLRNGGDWQSVNQTVTLMQVDCHYGGQRTYARCPGIVNGPRCGRRVGKLFMGGRYFLCRHCCNIAYTSQSEPKHYRMLSRAHKLQMALVGESAHEFWLAPKPKGMWLQTYQRKRHEIEWYENQANIAFLSRYAHMLSVNDLEQFIW